MKKCSELPSSELDQILSCSHTRRCLLNAGVTTLDQLLSLSHDDLLKIKGIGQVIAKDVIMKREQYLLQSIAKEA